MNGQTLRLLLTRQVGRPLGIVTLVGFSSFLLGATKLVEHANVAFDISPDGEQIVFAAADGDLYLLQLKTSRVSPLTKTPGPEYSPAFSPDGSTIIYAADIERRKGSCLFVFSLADKQARALTNSPDTKDILPSYSPDGSQIVFARAHRYRRYSFGGWTWDDWDLYVMKSDGSGLRRLTREKHSRLSSPKFLPDGSNIVYSANADRAELQLTRTLFVVDVSGKQQPRSLTNDPPSRKGGSWASEPDVFKDGRVTFISDRGVPFRYDVFVMEADGRAARSLDVTAVSPYNRCPVFLPGGRSLLFLAGQEWNPESRPIFSLWTVNTDGSERRCIARSVLFTEPLAWEPNK